MLKILPDNLKTLLNHKVVKAGSWYTLTEFFLKGVTFFTIPIFTRLLSTADYGIVSLYETWVKIFSIFLMLGISVSISNAKIDFKYKYNQFTSSVTFLSLISFVAFLIILIFFDNFFVKITGFPKLLFYFMFVQAYFKGINEILIAKLRFEYKYKAVSIISIFIVIIEIILSIYLILNIFTRDKFYGAITGKGSLVIFSGLIFIFFIFYKGKEFVNLKYWKYSLILGVPIIFHSLSHIINSQFDRILINKYIDATSTGIYSFAYNVGMVVTVFLGSMNTAWLPWSYEKMGCQDFKKIKIKAEIYRNIFSYIYIVVLFLTPELIKIMSEKSYWIGLNIIPWIFMAYFFQYMYTFEVNTEFFFKKNKLIAFGTIISAILNIFLNILFIPKYGYVAAAITTVFSYFFLFVFHFIITSFIIKKNIYGMKFHLVSFFYVLVITILFLIFQNLLYMRLIVILLITFLMVMKLNNNKDF